VLDGGRAQHREHGEEPLGLAALVGARVLHDAVHEALDVVDADLVTLYEPARHDFRPSHRPARPINRVPSRR
jgi:hypothetical protein